MTRGTSVLTDAEHVLTWGPRDLRKGPGAGRLFLRWAGSLTKVCSEGPRQLGSGAGRASHCSARHHSNAHPPKAAEATDGTAMIREKQRR